MPKKMYEIAFELAGKINSSFKGAFSSANDKLINLNREISSLKTNIKNLEKAQRAGIISAKSYAATYDVLTKKLEKAKSAQRRLTRATELQQKVGAFRQQMRGNMIGAVETSVAVGAPVRAAMMFESAMADVKKVVDFDTPEQFKTMEKDIINLTKHIPMAAEELAQIVAAGGQAGIARNDLTKFAEAAAQMGVAFDITAEEAGQTMAQWRSAFKMNQDQVNTLADQINFLGNTTAASAPKISEVVRRIGPLGEVGGAAAAEIAALGATMVSSGIQEEIAATGIKNMILNLTAGAAATKSQQEAFKSLGLDAKKMAKMMQEDAQGAILLVLGSLQELPKHTQASVMTDLFGKESVAAIAPLLTNMEALQDNLDKVGDATQYAGSMQKEFEARSDTTENHLQLLKNNANALAITVGKILLPGIVTLSGVISKAANKVQAFTEKHPALAKVLVIGTASVLGLSVALTGLMYVAGIIASPFISMRALLVRLTTAQTVSTVATQKLTLAQRASAVATNAWAKAQRVLNIVMRANHIGLIITGVGALIGAGYLLIKNWDKVSKWFVALFNDPKKALSDLATAIREKLSGPLEWLEGKITWLKDKGGKLLSVFTGGSTKVASGQSRLLGHATGGIFTKPHIAWFAEKGPEAAIPLDGSSRAISLWAQAGEILGVGSSGGNSIVYSPNYYIYGGNDVANQVRQAARSSENDFAKRFGAFLRQERRLAYD